MEPKRRKLHPLVILVIALLSMMLLLCGTVLALWLHGRNSINQEMEAPQLPQQTEAPALSTTTEEDRENLVVYQGKNYRYNEKMRNILLMGIDSEKTAAESAGEHDQADVVVLAALDPVANKMTLISISRDTMCNFQATNSDGSVTHLLNKQLALAYAYGDGQNRSCEMVCEAVSNIFYGLPIQGYGAYYMAGIGDLNDAVGGVTVTILDDFPFSRYHGYEEMIAGRELKLKGFQAIKYIRARLDDQVDANALRMQRQKQYLLSLIVTAKQAVLEDPASVLSLYDAVDEYVLTNFDLGEISYLATEAAGMDFSGDLRSLTGELTLSEEHYAELHLDQDALFELILDVFYTEVK